eukprot:Sspe_Gene.7480::Locus_2532_Transcript_1_1_Confidence_1.000_Length_1114::g.7480::m.7480/K09519/DNAJB13; DnaJ homolog subfamily B member 13
MSSYYEILGITRDAQNEDIAKAFRTMALKYHPELNKENRANCAQKFRQVAEAYEVLRNPKLRAIFDEHGADGLREGGTGDFGIPGGYKFSGDPNAVFKAFFGVANPFQMIGEFSAMDGTQHMYFSQNAALPRVPPQCPSFETTMECTLEELYTGTFRQVTVSCQHMDKSGEVTKTKDVALDVQVQPGTLDGTKVRFQSMGTSRDGYTSGDVYVVIKQLPHSRFKRDGDDLIFCQNINLTEALCGLCIPVPTLDNRTLNIFINDVIHPKYTKAVAGEGMPRADGTKGDLVITFDTKFPMYLTEGQKKEITRILAMD